MTEPLDANSPEPERRGRTRDPARPGVARRIGGAWRTLGGDQRLAAGAALALFICLILPWYSTSPTVVPAHKQAASLSHSGLSTFGWVEAAVLLVAVAVLFLLFARAERRAFHLPGGDGGVIAAAGVWVVFLVLWRFFDRPGFGTGVAVGLQWGIFVTLAVGPRRTTRRPRCRGAGASASQSSNSAYP